MNRSRFQITKPPVVCADGFTMSVQASSFHYCHPRVDDAAFYTHYEVGFPSEREALLLPFMERQYEYPDEGGEGVDVTDPTNTVYAGVPVEVVAAVIQKHGGLK